MALDEKLVAEVDAYVDRVWPDVLDDIRELVSHPGVADYDQVGEGNPYGEGAHESLRCALGIAERLGLAPTDCDGHIGFADLPGASQDYLATIAHVDVVPAGTGWSQDPFTMTIRDGYLMGRGVLDDKGPAVLSLYAAHFFVERGERLPYTLRAILGSDEEMGMRDAKWYLAHYPEPLFLFTPDAEFPVCSGEKGHYSAFFTSPVMHDGAVVTFDAGTATNAIPGFAQVTVRADADRLPKAEGIDVERLEGGLVRLTAHGKGGHASLPAGTRNAIGMLVSYLRDSGVLTAQERPFFDLLARIHGSTDGSTLGIADADEAFGAPTCVGGVIKTEGGRISQSIDTRFTTALTIPEIERRLGALASEYGATFEPGSGAVPYLTDPSSAPVQALIDTYNEVTGRDAKPFTIGGGTYARNFAHAVSFGPEDPQLVNPAWVGTMHGPDEGVSEALLRQSLKLYILGIDRLMHLSYAW